MPLSHPSKLLAAGALAAGAALAYAWSRRGSAAGAAPAEEEPLPEFPCFLREDSFWTVEADAPIRLVDRGFLDRARGADGGVDALVRAALGWCRAAGVGQAEIDRETAALAEHQKSFAESGAEFDRIFLRDAERAFRSPDRQATMMHVLTVMQARLGDYHQGMGLVAGFLLLTLDPPRVLALLTVAATDERYVPEIWRAESIASATDGYVLWEVAEAQVPRARAALARHQVLPETLVQKWFCALSVHVLPFEALFAFFTRFFAEGRLALFRLGLAILKNLEAELETTEEQYQVYELLRLDFDRQPEAVTDELTLRIVAGETLDQFELGDEFAAGLAEQRERLYNTHLRARIEAANASLQTESKMQTCQFCNENECDDFCMVCEKLICDSCRNTSAGEHDEDEHPVRWLGDCSDDDEE